MRVRALGALVLAALLASCTHLADDHYWSPPPVGLSDVTALNPRFIVFGEQHGTAESPRFVGDIADTFLSQGRRVLVALEISAADNAALQRAWAGPHRGFADRVTGAGWAGRQDGVGSIAMRDLLVRLHQRKSRGQRVSVVAFNGYRDIAQEQRLEVAGTQTGHERAQAENIGAAAEAAPFDIVLVLVGESHARRSVSEFNGAPFEPMAMHLAAHGRVVSLGMAYASGTAWYCGVRSDVQLQPGQVVTGDMVSCGAGPMRGINRAAPAPALGLGRLPEMRLFGAFDGYYWLGPITASPPAVP
jgi:hypothetical protein